MTASRFDPVRTFIDGLEDADPDQSTKLRRLLLKALPDRELGELADAVDAAKTDVEDLLYPLQAALVMDQAFAADQTREMMHDALDRLESLCKGH